MEPEAYVRWDAQLDQPVWVCLEMVQEGIKCGWAFLQRTPWGEIAIFQGWLL